MQVEVKKSEGKRKKLEQLRAQLSNERSTYLAHWRDLSDFIFPRRARFTVTDVNQGDRRNQKIIDSTATLAARTLRSGMMAGITSPARPWFRLTVPDQKLAEVGAVKTWLHTVTESMSHVFLKSNLYQTLPVVYGDLGVFGTAAMFIEEDFNNVIHCYPFPIGSYYLATSSKGKVDCFVREFRMTVRQMVQQFGIRDKDNKIIWDNFSTYVKNQYENDQQETWIDICHCVKPNEMYNPNKLDARFKKYESTYYEMGFTSNSAANYIGGTDTEKYLRESGYDNFPVLAPRWEVTAEDVYGTECPAMSALGDIKQLQLGEKRIAQAVEKMVNPPMSAPSALKNQKASLLPGDITYVDVREGQQGFRPVHEVQPRINEIEAKQEQIRMRIKRSFYEDLFLMLANSDRRQITAREIEERHEEKLLAIGPVLEQLNQDLLDPLIDNTFAIMLNQGRIPPPPQELQGQDLKVEYISVMAQSQKMVGIGGIERFAGFVGQLAAVSPEVLDKIDADQVVDIYGDIVSVPPGIIRPDDAVSEIRSQRAEAQAQAAKTEQMATAAGAAKQLSETKLEDDSALTRLIGGA